ncbi:MAG: ABC transporter ATP-binding protein [Thermotogae bacterium]|nr:ABC transporter ATP-binding protein [Thermotogota bacterium]
MIKLEEVTKVYRMGMEEVRALDGVTLWVDEGEMLVIMGPSGSGKSTLLHIMGCLDRPTEGKVFIDGEDISRLNDAQLARLRNSTIGFVFQQFNLLPRMTAFGNIELPLIYAGIPRKERIRRVKTLLKRFELEDRARHRPGQLSGGQQQRVAIARALANEPKIILADEPTGNLDTASGKTVIENLVKLNKEGITVIVVTHDPEVASIGHRIIYLRDGKIVGEEVK